MPAYTQLSFLNKTLSVCKVASHFDLSKSKDGAQRGFSPGIPVSPLLKYQPMVWELIYFDFYTEFPSSAQASTVDT